MNRVLWEGHFVLGEGCRLIHIDPVVKEIVGAFEVLVLVEAGPESAHILVQKVYIYTLARPALSQELLLTKWISHKGTLDRLVGVPLSDYYLLTLTVDFIILLVSDVRVSNDSEPFLIFSDSLSEKIKRFKSVLGHNEVQFLICMLNVKPKTIYWHIEVIELIEKLVQESRTKNLPAAVVKA